MTTNILAALVRDATESVAAAHRKLNTAMELISAVQESIAVDDSDASPVFGIFRLGTRSLQRLEGVHPDMMAVVQYAIRISAVDFGIPKTGGKRTVKTQHALMGSGASKTLRSRHLTGHASDIYAYVDGKATWEPQHVMKVHAAFEAASLALDVPLRWGGDWDMDGDIRERGEDDLVHHELPRRLYGVNKHSQSEKAAAFLKGIS